MIDSFESAKLAMIFIEWRASFFVDVKKMKGVTSLRNSQNLTENWMHLTLSETIIFYVTISLRDELISFDIIVPVKMPI